MLQQEVKRTEKKLTNITDALQIVHDMVYLEAITKNFMMQRFDDTIRDIIQNELDNYYFLKTYESKESKTC